MNGLHELLDLASEGTPDDALDVTAVLRDGRARVRRRNRIRAVAAAAAVAAVAVAGSVVAPNLIGGSERTEAPTSPTTTTPTTPSNSATPAPDTAPGSVLDVDETAVVPVEHLGTGRIDLTMTAVRPAPTADILAIPNLDMSLREDARRGRFWYVEVTMRYRSGDIGGYYLGPDVEPVVRGGRKISSWASPLDTPDFPCRSTGFPLHPEPGTSARECLIFQTAATGRVVGLKWGQTGSAYDIRGGEPVVWLTSRG